MKRRLSAYLQHLEPNIGSNNGSMEETILREDLVDDYVQGMSDDEQEEPEKENDLIVDPLQDERTENTITSDSEWNLCVNKCNFDHWNLLSTPIKSMMDEILKFTTAAQLSESNLKNMLGLLHTCTKLTQNNPHEDFSKLLNLNAFYNHYNLNNKTKKVFYCKCCKDFQLNL